MPSAVITYFADNWSSISTACGSSFPPVNDALFAAVSFKSLSDQSAILNSNKCGTCIRLESSKGSVVVTVVDVMLREDANPEDLDLSTAAFDAVANIPEGIVPGIQYSFVDCQSGAAAPQLPSSIQASPSSQQVQVTSSVQQVVSSSQPTRTVPTSSSAVATGTATRVAGTVRTELNVFKSSASALFASTVMAVGVLCAVV
ncbi:hypothetical protein CcCBS67573_g08814 [Chytriomyces confervae]|uniref:Expansin-like EG45 domain-containing protein n=1 Tax=Chytriomyces confervae TaxID=246404 RepID=A0A507EHM6_9FUNG|nr:hypothetical protein CcCBS67573_g08814 [Chytriomyces confervae]